ncbi:MAG: YCF48-related protein [Bryobacteraceae bacterium]
MNRSPMGDHAKILRLSQFVRSRLASQQTAPADHLDPGVLAAFAEQRLSAGEYANTFTHLAQCPECREVLALTAAIDPEEIIAASRAARHPFAWWAWRCAATTILACLIAALTWRTFLIQHAPLSREPKAPMAVPPPQMASTPRIAEQGAPQSLKTKKSALAKKPASSVDSVTLKARIPYPPPAANALLQPNGIVSEPAAHSMFQSESRTAPQRVVIATAGVQKPGSLWRLSGDQGTLEKSYDGGATWQPIRLDEATPFYALSVIRTDIWVGGADGTLYHSADDGLHWKKVLIKGEDNSRASGPVTRIQSRGRNMLRVATGSGDHWKTTDGGLHWQQE